MKSQLYSMKQACELTGLSYDTLKFYCNEGLVPDHHRGPNSYRLFDDNNIAWIKALTCLKNCHMTIAEMKHYVDLCIEGEQTIPLRQNILAGKRADLLAQMQELQAALNYIDWKQDFYRGVLAGTTPYTSNLHSLNER